MTTTPMSDADYAAAEVAEAAAKATAAAARKTFTDFDADFKARAKQHETLQKAANDATAAHQKILQPLAVETARRKALANPKPAPVPHAKTFTIPPVTTPPAAN